MANGCEFGIAIHGKPNNVQEVINAFEYNNNKDIKPFLFGVLYNGGVEVDDTDDNIRSAILYGDCKWSVLTSFLKDECSYFSEYIKEHPDTLGTNLIDLSKKTNTILEIYSFEPDEGFCEHYIIQFGEVIVEQCVNYSEYSLEGFDSVEEINLQYGTDFTQEQFKKACNLGENITVGGLEWYFDVDTSPLKQENEAL